MTDDKKIEIESGEPLSPHNRALYETGKEMLKSSITTGSDFCKFMVTLSTGAIPTYLALLKFVLPEKIVLTSAGLSLLIISPFIFLISSVIFVFGYQPTTSICSLDLIDEIKRVYEKTINRRRRIIIVGFILFLAGTVSAILSIITSILGLSALQ
jgi:hypothetical protein